MEQALARPRLDHGAGDVAGRHDGVVGLARHMQLFELARHDMARARRVGDQDHGRAALARAHQRVAGVRERLRRRYAPRPRRRTAARRSRAPAPRNAGARAGKIDQPLTAPAAASSLVVSGGGLRRIGRGGLQGFDPHRPRRREQEALAEAHVVVEQVDHHAFAFDALGDQIDAGARQQVGEIAGVNVALRGGGRIEQELGRHLQEAEASGRPVPWAPCANR